MSDSKIGLPWSRGGRVNAGKKGRHTGFMMFSDATISISMGEGRGGAEVALVVQLLASRRSRSVRGARRNPRPLREAPLRHESARFISFR